MNVSPAKVPTEDSSLHIFVVENHRDTLESFILYLRLLGHRVSYAESKAEALARLPDSRCDVLFSDIGLPDGTGWELVRELKTHRPPVAVAMSGFGMNADRAKSLEAGFHHHLVKPIPPEQLETLLADAVRVVQASDCSPASPSLGTEPA